MKKTTFRFLYHNNLTAKKNMLIDKLLLDNFHEKDKPILRLYTWNKSITVGASQNCTDYSSSIEHQSNCFKRITGGGILFHGHDISYSIVLPRNFYKKYKVREIYCMICEFIINFYKSLGLNAQFASDIPSITYSKDQFCQIGIEQNDIIIQNQKIGGNAQKWTKEKIFQHGSIPIKRALFDSFHSGYSLEDFNIYLDFKTAKNKIMQIFESTYLAKLEDLPLSEQELQELDQLIKNF